MSLNRADAQQVAGLVLAAGRASRFGSDKRMASLPDDGRPLLQATLETFTAVLSLVLVVLRSGDAQALRIAESCGAVPVICQDADLGMGHSLAQGARALQGLSGHWSGLLIGLADMPCVSATTLHRLSQALIEGGVHGRPVAPVHQGRLGHPRGLPMDAVPALCRLSGDQGARHLLDWQLEALHIEVDDPGILQDVDTPADLAALKRP